MIRSLQTYYQDLNQIETLLVGQEYCVCILEMNNKYTGFLKNVKPFKCTLIYKDNSYYKKNGSWSFGCLNWDMSKCKNKVTQPEAAIWYYGYVCDTEEECIEQYNILIDKYSKEVKSYVSNKYNKTYIKEIIEKILKSKIKIK